jgi:hypothetical protein
MRGLENAMYIYKHVPPLMEGDFLLPVNLLQKHISGMHERALKRYLEPNWRLERTIPYFSRDGQTVMWNDVLHCSAVHPHLIWAEMNELGRPFEGEYFMINTRDLDPSDLLIFTYEHDPSLPMAGFIDQMYVSYTEESLARYTHVPARARENWMLRIARGQLPPRYEYIPQVLVRGPIPVDICQRIRIPQ